MLGIKFDKISDSLFSFVKAFVAVVAGTVTVLTFGSDYIKTQMKEAVEVLVQTEINPLKEKVNEMKPKVDESDKMLTLLTYRVGLIESQNKQIKLPTISKEAEKPEEVSYYPAKKKTKDTES